MSLSGHEPELDSNKLMIPLRNHNVSCMSMGFLVDEKAAIVWRGLMVMNAIERLMFKVNWAPLDLLVIDMPPGTGDVQLSISQHLKLNGAVIVSTPQDIALLDARRAVEMFKKVNVPILGLVQNMSAYACTNCGHIEHIFGKDGANELAKQVGCDALGDVELISEIRKTSDLGQPIAISSPEHFASQRYAQICEKILNKLNK
jgi:ATP-binding protein involved in chromosome partitioning